MSAAPLGGDSVECMWLVPVFSEPDHGENKVHLKRNRMQ
jgi:hypothetical protein